MNPYLKRLRDQYEELRKSIEGFQTRAADENRDLSETELTAVRQQGEQATTLAAQITELTEIENRNTAVANLAADLAEDQRTDQTRTANTGAAAAQRVGTAAAKDRDPGHYRRDGRHSFFGDMFMARTFQDQDAVNRLAAHNRALDMPTEGLGVIPPVWLAQEFQLQTRQERRVASAVRNLPLANAAPLSLPKQTAGTDAVVLEQAAENNATSFTDAWDTDVDTVAPKATSGGQIISRQLLDSGNPAVDAMIYTDLLSAYDSKVEAKVVAAMITAAGAALAGNTYATEAAWTALTDAQVSDIPLDLALAVRVARKLPADILITSVARYGEFLKLKDSTNRPLMPQDSAGPMNVIGTGSVAVDGRIHGLGVLASDGITQYPESLIAARASDTILFESPALRFSYEQPLGPESIKIGIWAYTATYVKYAGKSVKRGQITAA